MSIVVSQPIIRKLHTAHSLQDKILKLYESRKASLGDSKFLGWVKNEQGELTEEDKILKKFARYKLGNSLPKDFFEEEAEALNTFEASERKKNQELQVSAHDSAETKRKLDDEQQLRQNNSTCFSAIQSIDPSVISGRHPKAILKMMESYHNKLCETHLELKSNAEEQNSQMDSDNEKLRLQAEEAYKLKVIETTKEIKLESERKIAEMINRQRELKLEEERQKELSMDEIRENNIKYLAWQKYLNGKLMTSEELMNALAVVKEEDSETKTSTEDKLVKKFYKLLQHYTRVAKNTLKDKDCDLYDKLEELRNHLEEKGLSELVKIIEDRIIPDASLTEQWMQKVALVTIADRYNKLWDENSQELKEKTDKPCELDLLVASRAYLYRDENRTSCDRSRLMGLRGQFVSKGLTGNDLESAVDLERLKLTQVGSFQIYKYALDLLEGDDKLSLENRKKIRCAIEARMNFYIPQMCVDSCNEYNDNVMDIIKKNLDRIIPLFVEDRQINEVNSRVASFIPRISLCFVGNCNSHEKSSALMKYLETEAIQFSKKQISQPLRFFTGTEGAAVSSSISSEKSRPGQSGQ